MKGLIGVDSPNSINCAEYFLSFYEALETFNFNHCTSMKTNVKKVIIYLSSFRAWLCRLLCLRYCFIYPYKNVSILKPSEKVNMSTFIVEKNNAETAPQITLFKMF